MTKNTSNQNRDRRNFTRIGNFLFYLGFIVPICTALAISTGKGLDHLVQLKANEVGDFLAGIFGPGALLILASSLLLQKEELTLQREELQETRATLADQSKQLAFSAKEAERQNKILEIQLNIAEWNIRKSSLFDLSLLFDAEFKSIFGGGQEYSNIEEFYRQAIPKVRDLSWRSIGMLAYEIGEDIDLMQEDWRKLRKNRIERMIRYSEYFIVNIEEFIGDMSDTNSEVKIMLSKTSEKMFADELDKLLCKIKNFENPMPDL